MSRAVDVRPATLRDVSYIVANLRPGDAEEVMCQLPDGARRDEIAYGLLMGGDAFVATWRGQPVMAFGTAPINVVCLSVWAVGTKHTWRVANAVSRFMRHQHLPDRIAQGYLGMEARSLETHRSAHRWMEAMGAVVHGEPFVYGKGRQKFLLFRWNADDLTKVQL